jgi:phytoene synthase
MNSVETELSRTAPPGSTLYYSLLKLPAAKKQAIMAIFALCRHIQTIAGYIREESVARAKLAWWAEELALTYQKQARHPATQALQTAIETYQLPKQLFDELITGEELKLDVDHCCSQQDFLLYCYRQCGIRTVLTAYVGDVIQPHTIQCAHDMGVAIAIVKEIEQLRAAIQRERVYFPLEDFAAFNIEPSSLSSLKETDSLHHFLQAQADKARIHYKKALTALPVTDRAQQRHILTYGKLIMALLTLIEKDGFHVLQYQLQLTPLRKFWISCR